MNNETRICPKCSKKMIVKYADFILLTYPTQHPWSWWCGCGHSESGGLKRGKTHREQGRGMKWILINRVHATPEELLQKQWEDANPKQDS